MCVKVCMKETREVKESRKNVSASRIWKKKAEESDLFLPFIFNIIRKNKINQSRSIGKIELLLPWLSNLFSPVLFASFFYRTSVERTYKKVQGE